MYFKERFHCPIGYQTNSVFWLNFLMLYHFALQLKIDNRNFLSVNFDYSSFITPIKYFCIIKIYICKNNKWTRIYQIPKIYQYNPSSILNRSSNLFFKKFPEKHAHNFENYWIIFIPSKIIFFFTYFDNFRICYFFLHPYTSPLFPFFYYNFLPSLHPNGVNLLYFKILQLEES